MFVTGHIGKLGTGSADKCKTTIFVEALDARKLDWELEISGNDIIWHLADASGFNPITITPDGTPIAVYERCALTDKEIIVFTGDSASPTYDIYDYSGALGTIVAFDACWNIDFDKLQAYAATPDGDVYFFDSALGNFTYISNFGSVVRCICFLGHDSEEGVDKTYNLLLTSTGDLYRITEDDPNSITLVMQNVRGLGYDIGYFIRPVLLDDEGNVYIYDPSNHNLNLVASNISDPIIGSVTSDEGVTTVCRYKVLDIYPSKRLYGMIVTDWLDWTTPVWSERAVDCSKPYMTAFHAVWDSGSGVAKKRYLIGSATEYDTYSEWTHEYPV